MVIIKDISGKDHFSTEINEGSVYRRTLMKEEYILLNFSVAYPIDFPLGCFANIDEGVFEVVDPVRPSYNKDTGGYDYQLRLDAHYWKWKHKKIFYDRQRGNEAKWSLTQTPEAHLSIVASNIASLGYTYKGKPYVFSIDGTVETKAVTIQYDSTNIIDAISKIAEACGCEWWVEENYIFLGHCEDTENNIVDIEIGNELSEMTRSDSSSTYATRIYAFGAERNIPKNYRPDTDDVVVDGVVQKRLKLPDGTPFVDAYQGMGTVEAIENVVFFDNVYPRRTGTVSEVMEDVGNVVDDDNKPTGETYPIFRIKDLGLKDFKREYILDELRLVFQSGSLNGLDFALKLISSDDTGTVFEIIRSQDYGQFLPNKPLRPKENDTYILHGYDTSFVSDTLIGQAERELLEETIRYVEKSKIDPSVYTCKTNPARCAGYVNGIHDRIKEIDLKLGKRVNLINNAFFKDGRKSRVYGFEKKLDNKFECVYTIGESVQYSRIGEIENKLEGLKYNGNTYVSGGTGSGVYLIKTNDPTSPTDDNVFSSIRTLKEIGDALTGMAEEVNGMYLRKDIPDTARGLITFETGLCTPGFVDGFTEKAAGLKMYADGSLTLMELSTRKEALFGKSLSSPDFTSGFPNGTGWALAPYEQLNAAGVKEIKYKLEIDDITVRHGFRVFEMIVSQLVGENDNRVFSGQMKVDHIDPENNTIYLKTEEGILYNTFRKDDILMAQRFGGMPTEGNDYNVIKYYELSVTEAGIGNLSDKKGRLDYIRYTNFVGDISDVEEGDVLTRADNTTNLTRKGLMKIVTIDEFGAPYLDVVWGMKTDPENCTKVRLGNMEGLITPYWGRLEGWGLMATNAYLKGRFMLHTGEDVKTKFEITEGLIRSEISAVRTEINEKYNYLSNASFSENTDKWEAASNIRLFTVVFGRFLFFNDNFYSNKQKVAAVVVEGDRRALRLKKAGIKQLNANLAGKPVLELEKPEEKKTWPTFYLTFKYKCTKKGTLKIGFPGKDMFFEERLGETDIFLTKEYSAIWDGTGDFTVEFSGDIYIYSLSLTDNPLENYKIETTTRFYQTDTKIGLWAGKTDKIAGTVTTLGLDLDALEGKVLLYANKTDSINNTVLNLGISLDATNERLSLYANKTDTINGTVTRIGIDLDVTRKDLTLFVKDADLSGNELVSRINLSTTSVKISSENINLKGSVTFSSLRKDLYDAFHDKVSVSRLGSMAYCDKVKDAMTEESVLIGGYFNTTLIKADEILAKQATIGKFKISDGKLDWTGNGDDASLALGYNSWFGAACIAVRAGFYGNGISAISDNGGAALFGSMYASPSYPSTYNLYAAYLDGDLVMTRGNIIVRSGGVSDKGAIQADRVLPQNGWSGRYRDKTVTVENGIITNVS